MTEAVELSRTRAWLMAARPQTLPVGVAPVLVGVGMAVRDGAFAPLPALAALLGAVLIQVGTNFANDYFDAVNGADTDDREGFTRVTQAGLISPERVRLATVATFCLAVVVGLYLVRVGGLPILLVGLLSILSGLAYTGGPFPFGYHGLGDLFVFVFFGLVAVTGTYYVQAVVGAAGVPLWLPAGSVPLAVVVASLPMAALATNVLVVNNVRDMETDAATGKRTLAVMVGYAGSRAEFCALLALAYLAPLWFVFVEGDLAPLAPLLTLPYAALTARTVLTRTDGDALNPALERAGKLTATFAALFALGLAI